MKLTITSIISILVAVAPSCQQIKTSDTMKLSQFAAVPSNSGDSSPKLVWISLDALQLENLRPYLDKIKKPHPRGLAWILSHSQSRSDLQISYPSITAPSHISTLTCAAPGAHGVFLNGGNWNGQRDQSGFAMSYKTETFVQRLKAEGLSVAVAAYPSVDGSAIERSADLGIAYDTPVGRVQYIRLSGDQSVPVELPSHQTPGKKYTVSLKLDAEKNVVVSGDFAPAGELTPYKAIDAFRVDGNGASERKAQVTYLNLGIQGDATVVAVSPISVTPVMGEDLKKALDAKDIVWSNIRDYGYAKYNHGVELTLETIKHRRTKSIAAVKEMLALGRSDAMFLYFEDIDVMLHAWIDVPEVENQLVDFIADFDQDLGKLMQSLPAMTNLVVMGDHGMSAIQYEINARALLPVGVSQHFQLRVSGGSLILYPKGALDSAVPEGLNLSDIAQHLADQRVEFDKNRKIFSKVVVRGTQAAKDLGLDGPYSPWIAAFAEDGIGLQDRVDGQYLVSRRMTFEIPDSLKPKYPDPMNSGTLVTPTPLGAHGHDSSLDVMHTHLLAVGPAFKSLDFSHIQKNVDVVPAVASALHWPKPESCLRWP